MLSTCRLAASSTSTTDDVILMAPPTESSMNRSDHPAMTSFERPANTTSGLTDTLKSTSGRYFAKLATGSCLMSSTSRLAFELETDDVTVTDCVVESESTVSIPLTTDC